MANNKLQSQASLIDQLRKLIHIANQEGLYDAADFIRSKVEAHDVKERTQDEKPIVD